MQVGETAKGLNASFVAQLNEVYALSDALHRAATLDEIYQLAVEGIIRASGAPRAAILRFDAGGVMRFQFAKGLSEAYLRAVEGHSPWRPGDSEPEPVLIEDASTDDSLGPLRAHVVAEGIGALAFVPISSNGELVGKFMLYFDESHHFLSAELDLAAAVAHHVGFAIERKQAETDLRAEQQLFVDGPLVVFKWRARRGWPVEFVSANAERLTGHPVASLLDGTVPFKSLIHGDDVERVRDEILRNYLAKVDHFEQEYRIVRADGATRWVRDFTHILRDEDGIGTHFHGYVQDVTAVHQAREALEDLSANLEARVAERTAALEDAYREIESFSYSVSHDLRGPVRWIDGFAALLAQRIDCGADPEASEMLGKIRAAAHRMGSLIDDMLALSRVSQHALDREKVDLSRMATEIVATLGATEPARRVHCDIAPGLVAFADPGLTRLLLENLLGNAWKFTARTAEAHIHFSATREAGEAVFCVSDNGAGFDPRYAGNLFKPFQRLHSADEFPGSGIGLANVARIVRRHGGRIEGEGLPGKGARFRFTLAREGQSPHV